MKKLKVDIAPGDADALVKEAQQLLARKLDSASRRRFLRQGFTLGGVVMLTGCDLSDKPDIDSVLNRFSRFNDRVQSWLFNPAHLSPEYSADRIAPLFPFNAFYGEEYISQVNRDCRASE